MKDKEIIQTLKDNKWVPYGGWTLDQRAMAHKIGISHFDQRKRPDIWESSFASEEFDDFVIYSLLYDYKEKPEIVECEVYKDSNSKSSWLCFKRTEVETKQLLHCAVNDPEFIGFKYEDDRMNVKSKRAASPRLYLRTKDGSTYDYIGSNAVDFMEVLTPTHVLFRKANP